MQIAVSPLRSLRRENLRPEVAGFGVPALVLHPDGEGYWFTSFRLPPGLRQGWHDVRLRTVSSQFGNALRIAVDMAREGLTFARMKQISVLELEGA